MSTLSSIPHFPRGFLLSTHGVTPPAGFIEGPLLANFFLHPWERIEVAGNLNRFVIILGSCVSSVRPDNDHAAAHLLAELMVGEHRFLSTLDQYSGRHVIIFGSADDIQIVNDATAMRSVFYAAHAGVVASHALLAELAIGGDIGRSDMPFKYGFPGHLTPYRHTRILTANTLYELNSGNVRRFWPRQELRCRSISEVAEELLNRSTIALQNMARGRQVKMALTAGLDSRALLAIALASGIEFETYTYGRAQDTLIDREMAVDLASSVGIKHTTVPQASLSDQLRERLDEAHYGPHHQKAVAQLRAWMDGPNTVAVTAHLLEVGGRGYLLTRNYDEGSGLLPDRASGMARLHFRTMSPSAKKAIREWGEQIYFAEAGVAFHKFMETTDYEQGAAVLDPYDQFYWEHRMSAWHGPAMNERDFYAEPFIPFNSRAIFEAMLGTSPKAGLDGEVVYHLIRAVDSKLLDLPVNPKRYGPGSRD